MTEPRTLVCAYGPCPVEFVPRKPWHEHCSPRCRNRAYVERREGDGADRAHASCDASETKISRASGPQVPLGRGTASVAVAAAEQFGVTLAAGRLFAERALVPALPARQRARILAREEGS